MTFAQSYRPATPDEQKELIKNITAASEQLKTLRADFVQRQTISILADELLSEGKLLFKQPDKLCWEYVKPYQYRFVINGNKVMTVSETNQNIIDANGNKMFNEISKIIISGINGSGIFDDNRFTSKFNVGTSDYQVELTPRQRDLRQMFNSITITFNRKDYSVNTVEIKQVSGDITHITMKNKQINSELSDEIFAIR
jgi:outer membrane lipoprotein carrier protein